MSVDPGFFNFNKQTAVFSSDIVADVTRKVAAMIEQLNRAVTFNADNQSNIQAVNTLQALHSNMCEVLKSDQDVKQETVNVGQSSNDVAMDKVDQAFKIK